MLGVRFFQGWGMILTSLIFLILLTSIKLTTNRIIVSIGLGLTAMLIQLCKGSPINYCILVSLYVIDACFMVYYTQGKDVKKDFACALHIYLIHAFISIIVYILVPKSLMWTPHTQGAYSLTFLYIFYYFQEEAFFGISRICGWAWEPGCLQMIINLYILFLINKKVQVKQLIIPSLILLFTGSTAGYAIYAMLIFVYFSKVGVRRFLRYVPIVALVIIVVLPLLWTNISQKLSLGQNEQINPSGAMRVRDFLVGIEEVKSYPLFGIDMSDLSNSRVYQRLEDTALNKMSNIDSTWHTYFDYAAGGYNNGFFCMHMLWGILGIIILYWFVKCRLWKLWCPDKYHYLLPGIILLTLVSSPLSNTALFLYFSLYNIVTTKSKKVIYAYNNYNSNV